MTTGFSGVDMDELQENLDQHDTYLSVIVNYAWTPNAKIAFKGKKKTTPPLLSYFNNTFFNGKEKEEEVMFIYNPTIEYEEDPLDLDDTFNNRWDEVSKKIKSRYEAEKKNRVTNFYPNRDAALNEAFHGNKAPQSTNKAKEDDYKNALLKILSLNPDPDHVLLYDALNVVLKMDYDVMLEYMEEVYKTYPQYITSEEVDFSSYSDAKSFIQFTKTSLDRYAHMFNLANKKGYYDKLHKVFSDILRLDVEHVKSYLSK